MKIPNSHQIMKWLRPILVEKYMLGLWIGMGIIALLSEWISHRINNNYFVFTHVYYHLLHRQPLYIPYPHEYADVNLYGPLFGVLIAPFALLPDAIGVICWVMANIMLLYWMIQQLPVNREARQFIVLFSAMEVLMNAQWVQTNAFIAACLIGSFVYFKKNKPALASLWVVLGTFTKLYGITGVAFLPFTNKPVKALLWLLIWSTVAFVLPMLFSSPSFVLHCYPEWFQALMIKNNKNINGAMNNFYQDISAMGLIKRITGLSDDTDIWIIGAGLLVMVISLLAVFKYRFQESVQYLWLSAIMLFTVLFSTGAESPTYVIAVAGVGVWFVAYAYDRYPKLSVWMLAFVLLLTSIASTDLLTPWMRIHIVRRYALKALPCLVVWLLVVKDLIKYIFLSQHHKFISFSDNGKWIHEFAHSVKNKSTRV